jgi:hypothetical protein
MQRKMQTNLRLTLILFCLHPDPLAAQSQKSQNWRIPIVPLDDAKDKTEGSKQRVVPPSRTQIQFEKLQDTLIPASASASDVSSDEETLRSSGSSQEVLRRLGLLKAGSETGRWGGSRLSIRGHAGAEPAVSIDGVLLSSGFSGAHAEELVPVSALSGLRAYPFFPSFGLPHFGVAGGYDLELISSARENTRMSLLGVEFPQALSSGGRNSSHCPPDNCLHVFWGANFFMGRPIVRDDRNTPLDDSDDRDVLSGDSDVSRISGAARHRMDFGTGSQLTSTLIAGGEGRGINGLPVSAASEKNRLNRKLLFASQEFAHLSPVNGFFGSGRLSAKTESGQFNQDLKNGDSAVRSDLREESSVSASGHLSVPLFVPEAGHRLLIESDVGKTDFQSTVSVSGFGSEIAGRDDSRMSGHLIRISATGGLFFRSSGESQYLVNASVQNGQSKMTRQCGVFAPAVLCERKNWNSSLTSAGFTAQWSKNIDSRMIVFIHAGRMSRLPRPLEIAGRPDGILANPNLRPEFTDAGEAGLRSRYGLVSVFAALDRDLISAEQVSPFLLRYINTPSVRRLGITADGGIRFADYEINGIFEKLYPAVLNTQNRKKVLPFTPSHFYRLSFARPDIFGFLSFFADFEGSGAYWLDASEGSALVPPALWSARIETPVKTDTATLEIILSIKNIFDNRTSWLFLPQQSRRPVAWSLSPVLPIQGRSFELSLRLLNQ